MRGKGRKIKIQLNQQLKNKVVTLTIWYPARQMDLVGENRLPA